VNEKREKWKHWIADERSKGKKQKGGASMATIVNILDKGRKVEIINPMGKTITFWDTPDGCHYKVSDICMGDIHEGKASATKNARECAMAFLKKKGKHGLAAMLDPSYKSGKAKRLSYLPCPAILAPAVA
jgi:hypothetical protein